MLLVVITLNDGTLNEDHPIRPQPEQIFGGAALDPSIYLSRE
jgi:hypothetical protein